MLPEPSGVAPMADDNLAAIQMPPPYQSVIDSGLAWAYR